MIENTKYATETLHLSPGDTVLLYTGGVTEAVNPQEECFGDNRLLNALMDSPGGTAHELVDHMRSRIAGFVQDAPTADDITLLAMHWRNG